MIMHSLKGHVDNLFKGHRESRQVRELKDEILSNLEAKVTDLIAGGMGHPQAVKAAIESIGSVGHLIDDNITIYINRYKIELLQLALLYSLIAWVITIPLRIIGAGILLNYLLLAAVIVTGFLFVTWNAKKDEGYLNRTDTCSITSALRYKKLAWLIWGLFIAVSVLSITAIHFGSNIWFSRPISISGPYQFAVLGINYALPFATIIIPLLFSASAKLMKKHEAGEDNEDQA